ncbi:hypothetical protein NHX12_006754 [Muraenolepis orangiensis]|uniref:Formiminotransferase N-terminal subdomain domain-containing protein n=1 Tax=Muraenolepis orangiensis TaxID=630683 RepID=A0A9Q0DNL7_9TELE|nr:hypothetical protein NHX12_006754 [Muraenolepis orangiensis]
MASSVLGQRLVACLLNVSEARRKELVELVAMAAVYNSKGEQREGVTVLNIFNDKDYNRSVITIVAGLDSVRECVLSACEAACGLIDMQAHTGAHPCMGAVDLIPIYPLGEAVHMDDCAEHAQAVAQGLTERVQGSSAFLFGWADRPRQRGLAQRRREMGWFSRTPDMHAIRADVGPPPQSRYGLTGVGASSYVMNCNVTIDTRDLALGRRIAAAIRESAPGGVPGVQPPPRKLEAWPSFSIGGETYCHAPASLITARVGELAGLQGVKVRGTALVGYTPAQCRSLAERALSLGIGEFWKEQRRGGLLRM